MDHLHKIQIRVPDGDVHRTEVLLDGTPVRGLTRVSFNAEADGHPAAIVRLEMYARDLVVEGDFYDFAERTFSTRHPEGA